ncbi:MAG: hypothetical protein K2X38_12480 [Gemmataceae bacterium]|nr:hypothetical protein [Gemmataceae bacterium]
MIKQKLPEGWDEDRIRNVIAHYAGQTEDEEASEIESALADEGETLMAIPKHLVPQVRALLAREQSI